jgi:hypothetical protein
MTILTSALMLAIAQVILALLSRFLDAVADSIHFKRPKSAEVLRMVADLFDKLAILMPRKS